MVELESRIAKWNPQTDEKFFATGDANAKKAFFMLGQYTKKVMECMEIGLTQLN